MAEFFKIRQWLAWAWEHRSVLSAPARYRGFGWSDRAVFCRIGVGPRLLSSTVDYGRLKSPKSKHGEPLPSSRLWQWVWHNHSVRKAIVLSLLATFVLLSVCVALGGVIFQATPTTDQIQTDVSILNTLAQVTGAIFGTLLAVITFSVGLRAQREDDASALLPFVAQRYGMFLIAGVAVAVTAADGIMPIMQPWIAHGAFRLLLVLNVLLIPVTLAMSLWLVCKVIQDAGVSNLENTLPVFKAKMRALALQDAWHALLFERYTTVLSDAVIEYNGFGWHKLLSSEEVREEFPIAGTGIIADVDLRALRRLALVISELGSGVSAEITVRPGDRLDVHATFVLGERAAKERTSEEAPDDAAVPSSSETVLKAGLSARTRRDIQQALSRLFIVRGGK